MNNMSVSIMEMGFLKGMFQLILFYFYLYVIMVFNFVFFEEVKSMKVLASVK